MTSRMVTVDLILVVSLRLRQWKLLPIAGEFQLLREVRDVLNGWAKQIEKEGLAVELETIAENALQVYCNSKAAVSWEQHLIGIGDQLIERAREIQELLLDRSVQLGQISMQKEIAKALTEEECVSFKQAALDITGLKNQTDAKDRLKKFLTWLRDSHVDAETEAWRLLDELIKAPHQLTTSAVELFKDRNYFPLFRRLS